MKKQLVGYLIILIFAFTVSAQEKEAQKFDELLFNSGCEMARAVLDAFFVTINNNPQTTGFIIVYEGKYSEKVSDEKGNSKTKIYLPRRGQSAYMMQMIRNHIKYRKQNPDRFLFINGGFREEFVIEFWLVPNGAKLPKPTPTLEKMDYRKGKPSFECNESS